MVGEDRGLSLGGEGGLIWGGEGRTKPEEGRGRKGQRGKESRPLGCYRKLAENMSQGGRQGPFIFDVMDNYSLIIVPA